jgi:hypothetical protein
VSLPSHRPINFLANRGLLGLLQELLRISQTVCQVTGEDSLSPRRDYPKDPMRRR